MATSHSRAEYDEFTRSIIEETTAMLDTLPRALARQWEVSPTPRPREDTSQRSKGAAPSRPVEDIVLDGRRIEVREAIRQALTSLGEVRKASDRLIAAVARFDGE